MKEIKIGQNGAGQRLDKFLFKYLDKAPKSFVYKMLRKKRIKLNQKKAEGGEMLKADDVLRLYLSDETLSGFMEEKIIQKTEITFSVIYEDENILIANKPANTLSQPDKPNQSGALSNQILLYLNEKGEYDPSAESVFTPALCNRLDRNTSGAVIIGKTAAALRELNKAVAQRRIKKYYLAAVYGKAKPSAILEGFISKNEKTNKSVVSKKGTSIKTAYKRLCQNGDYALLEVELITGKSHQIRAHLANEGLYMLGDVKYGKAEINERLKKIGLNRQFLHARKLCFGDMEGDTAYLANKEFISALPDDLLKTANNLGLLGDKLN